VHPLTLVSSRYKAPSRIRHPQVEPGDEEKVEPGDKENGGSCDRLTQLEQVEAKQSQIQGYSGLARLHSAQNQLNLRSYH
jgi:hypothetical protein